MGSKIKVNSKKVSANDRMFRSIKYETALPNNLYVDTCEMCHKDFVYKGTYVKDKLIKCPCCGYEMTFFKNNYEFVPYEMTDLTKEELEKDAKS